VGLWIEAANSFVLGGVRALVGACIRVPVRVIPVRACVLSNQLWRLSTRMHLWTFATVPEIDTPVGTGHGWRHGFKRRCAAGVRPLHCSQREGARLERQWCASSGDVGARPVEAHVLPADSGVDKRQLLVVVGQIARHGETGAIDGSEKMSWVWLSWSVSA
jgi:hypothetical protein